jgi:putative tryptophan/tyrosine transport system substrate-binding protein
MIRRRELITLLGGAAAAWPVVARAEQKPAGIGFLGAGVAETSAPLVEALKQGLRENGLVEGKDYVLEPHWAEGNYERFPAFARELVERGARVIIVVTIAGARAAQRATSVIPIIMASMNDPVGSGLVESLARPGGNTTGLATLNQDVTPKLVEFLHTLLPNAKTIAVLFNPANPSNPAYLDSARVEAVRLGMAVKDFPLNTPSELNDTFGAIAAQRSDGLLVIPDAATLDLGVRVAALALHYRIPVVSTDSDLTGAGGLISYGFSRRENYRRSAYFVKKVLDGAKPADLPVEQPTRILLSLNLKTAKALGLEVPAMLLARADEVIE